MQCGLLSLSTAVFQRHDQVDDADVREAALLDLGETEEDCDQSFCCLELTGAVVEDSGGGGGEVSPGGEEATAASATNAKEQRVCTHSMAGCSSICKSIAELAPDAEPIVIRSKQIAAIVLPIVLILIAIGLIIMTRSTRTTNTAAEDGLIHSEPQGTLKRIYLKRVNPELPCN